VSDGKRGWSWFSRKAAVRRRGAGDAEDEAAEAEVEVEAGDKEGEEEEARTGSAGTEANLERSPEVLEKARVRL
jgi:hypothetical protein